MMTSFGSRNTINLITQTYHESTNAKKTFIPQIKLKSANNEELETLDLFHLVTTLIHILLTFAGN